MPDVEDGLFFEVHPAGHYRLPPTSLSDDEHIGAHGRGGVDPQHDALLMRVELNQGTHGI